MKYITQLSLGVAVTISLTFCPATAHNGHGDELPWQACANARKNDACEYTNSHEDKFIGNCKLFSKALMCVRNKPIIRGENGNKKVNGKDNLLSTEQD